MKIKNVTVQFWFRPNVWCIGFYFKRRELSIAILCFTFDIDFWTYGKTKH